MMNMIKKPGMAHNMLSSFTGILHMSVPNIFQSRGTEIRYFSSSNVPYCSLHKLAFYVVMLYESDFFPELNENNIIEIVERIGNGTYTLSGLRALPYPKKEDLLKNRYSHIIIKKNKNNPDIYFGLKATAEDRLVLTALGLMLNKNIIQENLLAEKSLGMRILIMEYNGIVCSRGNVWRLYRLDLTKSIMTINRKILLSRLSNIVKDEAIMDLVGKFLYLPITNEEDGKDLGMQIRIPSSGFITDVLLNYALIEFDYEFQRVFPELDYNRYVHEVFVYFTTSESNLGMTFKFFEQEVVRIAEALNLFCEIISIGRGDAPVSCKGGMVSVTQDGEIEIKEEI